MKPGGLGRGPGKLNRVDESIIKAVGLFGGGIAHSGYTRGALSGAIAALSSMYSRGTLDEKESPITCLDIAPETSG